MIPLRYQFGWHELYTCWVWLKCTEAVKTVQLPSNTMHMPFWLFFKCCIYYFFNERTFIQGIEGTYAALFNRTAAHYDLSVFLYTDEPALLAKFNVEVHHFLWISLVYSQILSQDRFLGRFSTFFKWHIRTYLYSTEGCRGCVSGMARGGKKLTCVFPLRKLGFIVSFKLLLLKVFCFSPVHSLFFVFVLNCRLTTCIRSLRRWTKTILFPFCSEKHCHWLSRTPQRPCQPLVTIQ